MSSANATLIMDPPAIQETVAQLGIKKAHLPLWKMVWLGVIAGAYVAVVAQGMIATTSGYSPAAPPPPVSVLGGVIFAGGLVMIMICGAELFTGNCMMLVALLARRIYLWEMVLDWVVVFFANFFGCILFGAIIVGSGVNKHSDTFTSQGRRACDVAVGKINADYHEQFFKGILANFCVCLAVLIALSAKSPAGKMLGMLFPLLAFVVTGYDHVIANQYFFALATMLKCPGVPGTKSITDDGTIAHGRYWANLGLSLAGNILGAATLAVTYFFVFLYGTDAHRRHPDDHNASFVRPSAGSTEPTAQEMPHVQSSTKVPRNDEHA